MKPNPVFQVPVWTVLFKREMRLIKMGRNVAGRGVVSSTAGISGNNSGLKVTKCRGC